MSSIMKSIPEHYQIKQGENWRHVLQQKDEKLAGSYMSTEVTAKAQSFDYLGKVTPFRLITTRNGATIPDNDPTSKRWIRTSGFDKANLIDEFDDVLLGKLTAPTSDLLKAHNYQAKREYDQITVNALTGSAWIGEDGLTEVVLPSTQKVAVDYVESGSAVNSGMTFEKINQAKYILDVNEVPDEDRYLAYSAFQLKELLSLDKITNADYASLKRIESGTMEGTFMGFHWRKLQQLNVTSSVRECIAWHKSSILVGDTMDMNSHLDILPEQRHSLQIRSVFAKGATRQEEEGVVAIYCDES